MSRTTMQDAGDRAEQLVADRLAAAGWRVLGRNLRVGRAEIDILAVDPGPPATLVVVEVRRRGRRDFGLPEETVDGRKRARLWAAGCRLAATGVASDGTPIPRLPLRMDLVAVEPAGGREPWLVRHHRSLGRT
jgi:putative endonuclease